MADATTRRTVDVDDVGRVRQLAANVDPEAIETHREALGVILDRFEELREENAELRATLRRLGQGEGQATGDETPGWLRQAEQRQGRGGRIDSRR